MATSEKDEGAVDEEGKDSDGKESGFSQALMISWSRLAMACRSLLSENYRVSNEVCNIFSIINNVDGGEDGIRLEEGVGPIDDAAEEDGAEDDDDGEEDDGAEEDDDGEEDDGAEEDDGVAVVSVISFMLLCIVNASGGTI